MPACHIHIRGHVQGVFFRVQTKEKAQKLELTGWVKNTPEGSVEIFAEGESDALKTLEEWCKEGPRDARVDTVKREEAKEKQSNTFEIRY
jgi:acylphosphatase